MKISMTLPVMEPGLDRARVLAWVRAVEAGPWHSLAFGERIAFVNPEMTTLLGACAALTERVRLVTTVAIATMHDPVWLAKQLATVDVLSEGRLSVGLGIGGREEDYRAVGADLARKTNDELARAYRRAGSVPGVAGELGVAFETARRWLVDAGVDLRPRGRPSSAVAKLDIPEIARRYRAGESVARLGEAYEVSPATIRSRLIGAGVELRPRPGWKY